LIEQLEARALEYDPKELKAVMEAASPPDLELSFRPMFGGIFGYAAGQAFASLSNVGLALKMSGADHASLSELPGVKPLQYEPTDPPSKSYLLLPDAMLSDPDSLRYWIARSAAGLKPKIKKTAPKAIGEEIMPRICFVELPASNLAPTRSFYSDAFGLAFTDFGPSYSSMMTGDVDIGLQADASEATSAPLADIAVDDLETCFEAVSKAGGIITKPIFAFPGGRRFHFRDPSGNELAALKAD
jgi:uncharacterized protein